MTAECGSFCHRRPYLLGTHNKMFYVQRGEKIEIIGRWSTQWAVGGGVHGEGADATPSSSVGVGNFLVMKTLITLINPSPPFEVRQAHLGWSSDSSLHLRPVIYTSI